ncbi:TonB-dependent receptor [Occallatibacter riparius]|uniref:TonB-dependent receptor n=1 Tax=Occallatibacter riparius TaxID=1002689 RepID=A0A9J7BSI2_9BACT|nr:TonB-dependent receptor [Occallatibacter riparius]UWZ85843.1 TonB-dependent receptor [Occallatibacter riparius]
MNPRLRIWHCCAVFLLALLLGTGLQAQTVHGALAGVVTDSTGAVIPGASVQIKNNDTGTSYSATTTSAGVFRIEDVALGHYAVSVSATGFKTSITKDVLVQIGSVSAVDVSLQPGEVAEQVTVTSQGPTLETESSDIGGIVTEKQILDLPLALGGVGAFRANEAFVFLQPATTGPGVADNNGVFLGKVAGGQTFGNEVLIDGISQERAENGSSYDEEAPSVEALQEFKVTTSLPEAEFGRTTGGVESFVTKSGTNAYHGTVYDIYRDQALNANSWFNNGWRAYHCQGADDTPACRAAWDKGTDHKNDYGVNLGGPIRIPHVYNGRDKSFFFFNWEQLKYTTSSPVTSTVPTAAERTGDFSDRLTTTAVGSNPCDGTQIYVGEIFDPTTTKTVNGTRCRTAFAGNKIPSGMISSVAKNLLAYYPAPTNSAIFSNYTQVSSIPITNTAYEIRIDQNITDKLKVWGSYSPRENTRWSGNPANLPSPVSTQGWWQGFTTHFFRTGIDYNITPNVLNYLVFGTNRSNSKNYSQAANIGSDWSKLVGLGNAGGNNFPGINTGDAQVGLGNIGNDDDEVDNGFYLDDAVVWSHGHHNFKFGGEAHYQQFNHIVGQTQFLNFSGNETAGAQGVGGGLGFASLMLGLADNGGANNVSVKAPKWVSNYYAFFAQDDFKVTPNLTLNLGMRWDVEVPRKEAYSHTSNFSPTAIDPEYNIPGALVFADKCHSCNPRWADTWYKDFGPRVGFAWTPAFLNQKIVVRGGSGILYGPLVYNDFGGGMTTGYTVNPAFPSHNGFDPSFQIDAGIPAYAPPPNEDPGIYNGSYLPGSYITKNAGRPATVYNWNLQVQQQLAQDLIATLGYIGNRATNLASNLLNPNNMPQKYFSMGDALYQPFVGNSQGVQAPFPEFVQNWGGNPQLQAALRPFPQYDFIDQGCCLENVGQSSFNAMIATVQRHFHQGLNMQVSYTWGKTFSNSDGAVPGVHIGNNWVQDMNTDNLKQEKAVSVFDLRHQLVLSGLYELPFGKGKMWMNHGIAATLLGGWEVGTVQRIQSGQPISFGCAWGIPGFQNCIRFSRVANAPLKSPAYAKGAKHLQPIWLPLTPSDHADPNAQSMFNAEFSNVKQNGSDIAGSTIAFYDLNNNYNRDCQGSDPKADKYISYCNGGLDQPYQLPTTMPRVTDEIRDPPYFNNDLSVLKKFAFYENYTLSIKAEFLNTFNQHTFGTPDLQPYDLGFGVPTYTINGPRNMQLTARFVF